MIAYHFPPLAGSSGIQRTLRFAQHLPDFGWHPTVLTAHPRSYRMTNPDLLNDVPADVEVVRAQAWDTARHFSIAGRYPGFLARPDSWLSWWPMATWQGARVIERVQPDAIWSTYPIATAHLIGSSLARRSGLPWIADFRDPMAQEGYPQDPATWRSFERIERAAFDQAAAITFTACSAASTYEQRYSAHAGKVHLLENGYDEATFEGAESGPSLNDGKLTILHSGVVYPSERDPTQLFASLATLKAQSPDAYARLRIRFRAPVHSQLLNELADQNGVEEAIEILPSIGYRDALSEMMSADGLLLLQAANCNEQIPAKLYEYLRAKRPVLVLADPEGDTAVVAQRSGIGDGAPLNDAAAIVQLLQKFASGRVDQMLPKDAAIAAASRKERTRSLAGLLDDASV